MTKKADLRQALASGKTKQIIDILNELNFSDDALNKKVKAIYNRFQIYLKDKKKKITNQNDLEIELKNINSSILDVIDKMPEGLETKTSINRKITISIIITFVIGIIGFFANMAQFTGWNLKDIFVEKKITENSPFSLIILVHGKGGKQDMILRQQGEVVIDLPGGERRTAPIRENGEALFQNLPISFQGKKVYLNVDFSEPYRSIFKDSLYTLLSNEQIYLPVALFGLNKIFGAVISRDAPLPGVIVSINKLIFDTTDYSGSYQLNIPDSMQKKIQEVKFFKPGYEFLQKNKFPQDGLPLNVNLRKLK